MNPLLAVGLGWLLLRAVVDQDGASPGNRKGGTRAPRTIDASGPDIKLLPSSTAQPKPKAAPRGEVTLGPITTIKTNADGSVTRKTEGLPPGAPLRSPSQAAQPVKPKAAPAPTAKQAQATAAARASMPQVPASAQARVPAPPGTDLVLARKLAPQTASHIKSTGKAYDRNVVKRFQKAAGLTPDGLYGPVGRSALAYFGAAAPAPLFKGQDLKYVPPGA